MKLIALEEETLDLLERATIRLVNLNPTTAPAREVVAALDRMVRERASFRLGLKMESGGEKGGST